MLGGHALARSQWVLKIIQRKKGIKQGNVQVSISETLLNQWSDRFKRLGWGDAFVTVTFVYSKLYLEGIIDVKLFNKGMWDAALSDFSKKLSHVSPT